MGFGAFARTIGLELPDIEPLSAADMLHPKADDAIRELRVYLADLVPAWERYLQVGGFPRAVSDWVADREVSAEFLADLWDVAHGDALASDEWGELQTEQLLVQLVQAISSFFNVERAAREIVVHHETIRRRLTRLRQSYITWDCHRLANGQPQLQAQHKIYFVDPVYANLPHLRIVTRRAPDFTQLTEQQTGLALKAQHEVDHPGSFGTSSTLFHEKTKTGKEIDFVSPWLHGLPYEGKYTEGAWLREAQTAATAYGRCVLATRNVIERRDHRRAVAASMLAYLLDRRAATAAQACPSGLRPTTDERRGRD